MSRRVADGAYRADVEGANVDRNEMLSCLVDPAKRVTEANIQSAVRDLLLHGDLELSAGNVVILESPSGRKRIDVEVGRTLFEIKKDASEPQEDADVHVQLAGYVRRRISETGKRYVGVYTDGYHWSAWHLPASEDADALELVDRLDPPLDANADGSDLDRLLLWLDGIMATQHQLPATPRNVEQRLGAAASQTRLDLATLTSLLDTADHRPAVRLKRQLWRSLLAVASGVAVDDEDDTRLFLEHTYLVVLAELIGHAVIGYDIAIEDPDELLRGRLLSEAGVYGVIEQDFFDWVGDVDGGIEWVASLAERISRFDWRDVDHDVLKVLYESVIGRETRHRLGEYYTPDWLARTIVGDVVDDPSTQRVLDPSCGSGTFLFWAVRQALDAAEQAGKDNAAAIDDVTSRVFGMDVHPVAVTLARITYLLAISHERLNGDRNAFSVPVYLGDSVQFEQAEGALWSADGLVVHVAAEGQAGQQRLDVYQQHLTIPQSVIDDVNTFDQLVVDLTEAACDRKPGSPRPNVLHKLSDHGVAPADQPALIETFNTLCDLNDDGRNHIWGYYLRNLARPRWLAQAGNNVDRIVGNPPWLSYRHMPEVMQQRFKTLATQRGLWAGGQVATQQDLSALFIVRACELYLAADGRFGMVVPFATLSRQAYAGFRTGRWAPANKQADAAFVTAELEQPWQLSDVTPDIFPVPSAVVFGRRHAGTIGHAPMPPTVRNWHGRQPAGSTADGLTSAQAPRVAVPTNDDDWSPYRERFLNGATAYPRCLVCIEPVPVGPVGAPKGRTPVKAARSTQEKKPWKDVKTLTGQIENRFLRPLHLGSTVLPFRLDDPWQAVVPWDGERVLDATDPDVGRWPGLADWMANAEAVWESNRAKSAGNYTLTGWLNYQNKLTKQFDALDRPRVVYSKAGTTLTAAIIDDPRAIIDHKLYWCAAASLDEARYLTAILNAPVTTERVQPLQSVGAFGPRDFDKYVWALPIPHYDKRDADHAHLVTLATTAEQAAATVNIDDTAYPSNRGVIRDALTDHGVLNDINDTVASILVAATSD